MPWDSIDKWRDEDDGTERRLTERRRWNKLRGRRSSDKISELARNAMNLEYYFKHRRK